jgi:hypothetical protein
MWVKCSFADKCDANCSHKVIHDSDNYLSVCARVEARCPETGEIVVCNPVSEKPKERIYIVNVREVYIQPYRVVAKSAEEAIRLVEEGDGEIMKDQLEYSHTLGSESWTVE